jgi:type II secretion system protein J
MKLRAPQVRGFTLLEILVSIVIFGMILLTIYATWMMILRSQRAGQYAAAEAQRERICTRTIEEALSCVQSFNESLQYYGFVADNGDETLSFVARLPSSFPRSGRFGDLTTRRVTFSLEPDPESGRRLVLRQAPLVMDFERTEMDNPLVLARHVEKMEFEFLDPKGNKWVDEWTQTNQLPKLLKLNLRFGSGQMFGSYSTARDREVSRIIALPSMTVPSLYQVGVPQAPPGQPGGIPGRPGTPPVPIQPPGNIR